MVQNVRVGGSEIDCAIQSLQGAIELAAIQTMVAVHQSLTELKFDVGFKACRAIRRGGDK